MTTNTKVIIEKNKREILRYFPRSEYGTRSNAEAFVKAVNDARIRNKTRYGPATPYKAIYEMFWSEGYGPVYTFDMAQYLKKIGLTDEKKLWKTDMRPAEIYCSLMARDGNKLYLETVKKMSAPRKVVKKKSPAKKKTAVKKK